MRLDGASLDGARFEVSQFYGDPSLADVIGLTEDQLLTVGWLAEETTLPKQFAAVKARILQRRCEWEATQPTAPTAAPDALANEAVETDETNEVTS